MAMAVIGALMLAGCTAPAAVECTAASAAAPVVEIIGGQLEKLTASKVNDDNGARRISRSKIRAAIGQLVITLEDIRTSKVDPNSSKRFCTGTLKIRFPTAALEDADKAREAAEMNSVSDLADDADLERRADSFSAAIDFNVQPTDDGSKVFAETESGQNMFGFAAEVLASGLLRAAVEEADRGERQAKEATEQAQAGALTEQRDANLNVAKTDNQLASQTIGATWQSLSAETRQRLLPLQRAWIRKKNADCRVEAASASTDGTEMEVARLNCDTRATNERLSWLHQNRGEETAPEPNFELETGDAEETEGTL